jgi:hypothetical protein
VSGFWQRDNGSISLLNTLDSQGNPPLYIAQNGNIGISTANPTARLEINGNAKIKAGLIVDNNGNGNIISASSSGISRFVISNSGSVGINDPNPSNTLKVTGSICAGSSSGSCAGNSAGTIYAVNTSLQNADLAENYISSQILEPGDIIMPEGKNKNEAVVKTNKRYQKETIGIISSKPGITLNSEAITDETYPYKYPVALSGRVPVKVSSENGDIHAGDNITTSSIPGIGMKSTGKGVIIGRALENYENSDPNKIHKIVVFINLSFYDSTTGQNKKYNSWDNTSDPANLFTEINESVIENVAIGFIQAKKSITDSLVITTENITIGGQTLSEYITSSVEKLIQNQMENKTLDNNQETTSSSQSLISPLASSSAEKTNPTYPPSPYPRQTSAITLSPTPTATTSASASSSASLSEGLIPQSSASASLIATNSALQNTAVATNSALPNTESTYTNHPDPLSSQSGLDLILKSTQITNDFVDIASISAIKNNNLSLTKGNPSEQLQNLMVLGHSTLSDLTVAGNLNVGGSLILANNSINTIGNPLRLQPLREGNLSIMGELVVIDTNGNLKVNGNAAFAKNVTIKGKLTTNLIAPIPDSDLIIQLNGEQNTSNPDSLVRDSKIVIRNASKSAVLAINQQGDLETSGSGTFENLAAGGFNIIRGAQADTSFLETVASSSAGTAIIIANERERTIVSPYVSENSLIYLTAASDTEGLIPYIARQTPQDLRKGTKGSFTIAIPYPINKDIKMNWWIIN